MAKDMRQLAITKTPDGHGTVCLRLAWVGGWTTEYVTREKPLLELADYLEEQARDIRKSVAVLAKPQSDDAVDPVDRVVEG